MKQQQTENEVQNEIIRNFTINRDKWEKCRQKPSIRGILWEKLTNCF